jgi:NADH-quinone oxidoreductase subunit J
MNAADLLFYIFAALTLSGATLVIANPFSRSPVTSAMFLVLTLVSLSGLFVLLHAFFLAAVQILVYAGAVMVLFLFVIMLLDLPGEEKRRVSRSATFVGVLAVGGLAAVLITSVSSSLSAPRNPATLEASAAEIGRQLFTQYLLPFELLSVLLLAAMVGVILLSKKDLK